VESEETEGYLAKIASAGRIGKAVEYLIASV
jgi:hypothetical protein